MKISLDWLSDFVDWTDSDPDRIADRLTLCTAEVEKVEKQGALLAHCCVGGIMEINPHPKADRLRLAKVKTDQGIKNVVCGGSNMAVGQKVAFAHVGATVKWHGGDLMTLEKTKIRGEESEGMICAGEELDIGHLFPPAPEHGDHAIVDLSSIDAPVGTPLREALGLTDTVLHFSNTAITQRPDLFSHVGFARECVAIGLATWKKKPAYALPSFAKTKLPFAIKNDAGDDITRYCACLLTIDEPGETPDWMKKRLEATGWRSVNLPVDITNYVSMEVGMPLHSFDADDITGDVRMRHSKKGETIVTLDGVERKLPDGAVVLSDDDGIFDLLGIMGGLRSSTKDSTRRILLHSAVVNPIAIRHAIQATGHRTDASTVYEKGIPRVSAERGFARALELFLELVPGAAVASAMDTWGDDGASASISLSIDRVRSMLGTEIDAKEVTRILEAIECSVKEKGGNLTVVPPLHRLRDLNGPHDLLDEIGRIHGYDKVVPVMPVAEVRLPERDKEVHVMRESLREDGFMEILPLSLVGPELLQKAGFDAAKTVRIANPLGDTISLMQPSTLPALLEHASRSMGQVDDALRTFQWGHVFAPGREEQVEMGMLLAAKRDTGLHDDPLLRLKSSLQAMLGRIGFAADVTPLSDVPAWAHPGRAARLSVDGQDVGWLCEVHPSVRARFDLPARAAVCIVELSCLLHLPLSQRHARPIPQFPDVVYDVTVTRSQAEPVGALLAKIEGCHPLLAEVRVQDLYAGKSLPADQYNLTLRCTYRSPEKTLTEEEAKEAHGKVMEML